MDDRVNELLPLAARIAREFGNIPGLPPAEIRMAAQEALVYAASRFDPVKGDLTNYAATAIRNALRDLYERQVRHHHRKVEHAHAAPENPVDALHRKKLHQAVATARALIGERKSTDPI